MRNPSRKIALSAAALATCGALAACGSASPAPIPKPKPATPTTAATAPAATTATPVSAAKIAIRNYMFVPMNVTVRAGAKVTFTNDDQTAHTATASGGFDSGTIQPGHTATVTLSKPGTYSYHCQFHAFMTAHITVVK